MREINVNSIHGILEEAIIKANTNLSEDVLGALEKALDKESHPRAREILRVLLQNASIAKEEKMALCQDTGLLVLDVELGQEVHLVGGDFLMLLQDAVRSAYKKAYLRNSMVNDPFLRINTGDNTPAIIHINLVPGDKIRISMMPKGAGSENMGQIKMLKPSDGIEGVKDFILQVVQEAGAKPCPPIILGIGIGGNMEKAALLAKKSLFRPINLAHPDPRIASLEDDMLKKINALGIGPQGLGGETTALGLNIEVYPTHIASLPVAVNINCHSTRKAIIEI